MCMPRFLGEEKETRKKKSVIILLGTKLSSRSLPFASLSLSLSLSSTYTVTDCVQACAKNLEMCSRRGRVFFSLPEDISYAVDSPPALERKAAQTMRK